MTPPRLPAELLPKASESRPRYIRRPAPLVIDGCVVAVACARGRDPTVDLVALVRRPDKHRDVERLARWLANAAAWLASYR